MEEKADHSGTALLLVYLVLLVSGIILQLTFSRSELFFFINSHHNHFTDIFFSIITFFGDGILYVLVIGVLLHRQFGYAIHAVSVFLASSLTTQLMKRVLFQGTPRPRAYFEGISEIHLVPGIDAHFWGSFPSGHTMTAFSLAVLLTLMAKNKCWGFLFLIIALLVSYSRIYLAQHFYEDILAGFIIGCVIPLLTWLILENSVWSRKSWWHTGLIRLPAFREGETGRSISPRL